MGPWGVLIQIVSLAVDAVGRFGRGGAEDDDDEPTQPRRPRAPRGPGAARPSRTTPPQRRAPQASPQVALLPHYWCITTSHGRNASDEHCAYCNEPKTDENRDAKCIKRR